ncbi:MFS transporter [Paramuribaculum intestinale]|uniref:MFS transporter n=2 Tax=Muribaculaceae TaxID=2005473 RepID=UPI000F4A2435|nr:MFS transporter [Paramuribaculum intestinale]ROS85470.1 MFS transporter [Muribaculaceae bacterium Isolate-080 (Janvier)]
MPTFHVLLALSAAHCLNDLLQSVITAVYPMLKADLGINFAEIGLITLVYQLAASIFQPVVGYAFDRRPFAFSLPMGMCSTAVGILLFAFCTTLTGILVAVFMVGLGSATLHPEASRITSLAGRQRRGFAQSVFQVGGNFGGSIGPLLVALIVAPHDRRYVAFFLIFAFLCFWAMRPICRWYGNYLRELRNSEVRTERHAVLPLSRSHTIFTIGVIIVLIFSKYIYMASLSSYYTFYLIDKFGVSVSLSQIFLFVFVVSTAVGTLIGGPVGDRYGRKAVIWASILGTAPFSLLMPHVGLAPTVMLSFCAGFMLSSAFPAILLYAQELLPTKLGMISGLFFGFAFGVGGIASAVLGDFADRYGIEAVYNFCAYMPLLGIVAAFLPNLRKKTLA